MVTKAKEMLTTTICNQIEATIRSQVNERLQQMPRSISIAKIMGIFIECNKKDDLICSNNYKTVFYLKS